MCFIGRRRPCQKDCICKSKKVNIEKSKNELVIFSKRSIKFKNERSTIKNTVHFNFDNQFQLSSYQINRL